jgi:two-component system, OmpR family, response regulator
MSSPAGSVPRVLVVDDDPDMLQVIRGVLEDEGFLVTTAGDGGRAVASAEQLAPDLAVLDMGLPVLDGTQVAARLRNLLGTAFPVLAITADGHAAEKASRLAAYTYLRKPFDLGELVMEVRRGLTRTPS